MSKPVAKPARKKPADRQFVTALARGLDVLRCFDRPGITLGVSELARRAGINQPTTWRLVHTLVECGYLVRATDGQGLRIGVPALTLGYAAIEQLGFPALAMPYMRQITQAMGASTTLSVREGSEMIAVSRCDGDFVAPNQPVGWRAPLTAIPSGLAVLGAMPEPQRSAALAQLQAEHAAGWMRSAAKVAVALAAYAQDGFVMNTTMLHGQYAGVAVPLLADPRAEGFATHKAWALSCGGLAALWDTTKLRQAGAELLRVKALLEPAVARAA